VPGGCQGGNWGPAKRDRIGRRDNSTAGKLEGA
jgi:hypothetical protein